MNGTTPTTACGDHQQQRAAGVSNTDINSWRNTISDGQQHQQHQQRHRDNKSPLGA